MPLSVIPSDRRSRNLKLFVSDTAISVPMSRQGPPTPLSAPWPNADSALGPSASPPAYDAGRNGGGGHKGSTKAGRFKPRSTGSLMNMKAPDDWGLRPGGPASQSSSPWVVRGDPGATRAVAASG